MKRLIRRALWLAIGLGALWFLWWTRFLTLWPQVFYMTGPSMEPSIGAGEYFVAMAPPGPPRRGMAVVFRYQDEDGVFHVLRRVAALPGDTVAMVEGRTLVNGEPQPWPFRIREPKARRSTLARTLDLYTWGPVIVPSDSVFLLADTRDIIGWPDSRFLGSIAVEAIEAEARRIVWPPRRVFRSLR
jgi:signal peptidase I